MRGSESVDRNIDFTASFWVEVQDEAQAKEIAEKLQDTKLIDGDFYSVNRVEFTELTTERESDGTEWLCAVYELDACGGDTITVEYDGDEGYRNTGYYDQPDPPYAYSDDRDDGDDKVMDAVGDAMEKLGIRMEGYDVIKSDTETIEEIVDICSENLDYGGYEPDYDPFDRD